MKVENYEESLKVYIEVNAEEVEVEGGFKLVGETENGEKIESFLTFEEYFEGKNLIIG